MGSQADPDDFRKRVLQALQKALISSKCSFVQDEIVDYLAGTCCAVLEDAEAFDSSVEQELREVLAAQLEEIGASSETVSAVCRDVAAVRFEPVNLAVRLEPVGGAPANTSCGANSSAYGELLCRVEDLILMYGGSSKPLLNHTMFEIRRGHCYGIIGHNGAGKTSLMTALLSGAVVELPDSLSMVHVHGGSVSEFADLQSTRPEITARAFAERRWQELGCSLENSANDLGKSLEQLGFNEEMQGRAIGELSGGWRMRLALACAMLKHCDVLMLDEPTNHLDSSAIEWLSAYLKSFDGTSLIISHDPHFLNHVCTDIVLFDQCKLKYNEGNFNAFVSDTALCEEDAQALLDTRSRPFFRSTEIRKAEAWISFPCPEKIIGVNSAHKPILEMRKVSFTYSDEGPFILKEVSGKIALSSRVAVVGTNGSGKSTLLSVLCGELSPSPYNASLGMIIRHSNMRLSYIAQHHCFHVGDFLTCTAVQYFQLRFQRGYDEQLQRRLLDPGTVEEQQLRQELACKLGKHGRMVREIVGRQKRGKEFVYEIVWEGLDDAKQNTFETMSNLKLMRMDGMARALDERLASWAAGVRPLTDREIVRHLEAFQITEDMSTKQMIGSFSGGQKSRLLLGAACWTKPHVIACDEPTNHLDPETVNALAKAFQHFHGGVIVATHCQHFIDEVCSEAWTIEDGNVVSSKLNHVVKADHPVCASKSADHSSKAEPAPAVMLSAAAAAVELAAKRHHHISDATENNSDKPRKSK